VLGWVAINLAVIGRLKSFRACDKQMRLGKRHKIIDLGGLLLRNDFRSLKVEKLSSSE
jgi:hypothetical protein